MDEKAPLDSIPGESSTKNTEAPKEPFLEKLKFKIPGFSFVHTFLIPGLVVFLILLVGGGGTYLVASNVFTNNTPSPSNVSSISESNISKTPSIVPPAPTSVITPTPTLDLTPTPIASPAAGWTPYSFTQLFLNFSYPPGWFVNVGGTSGPPYLTVKNFQGDTPVNIQNKYSLLISRLEQVGITTISNLTTQLALNAVSSTYINGVNMGQVTVITSTPTTINGYQALERTVSYSAFPTISYYELYVLDGVSNVVKFMPQLDVTYGKPYLNKLITTIQFTN